MLNFNANTDTQDDTKATHIHIQIDHSTISACAGLTLQANINCTFVDLHGCTESDDTRCCDNTICPPEDGHIDARNMSRIVM
jgi:hypothetical protein